MDAVVAKINANPAWRKAIALGAGISKNAIHGWKRVPASRVQLVAKVTRISAREIRPDMFQFLKHKPPRVRQK